MTDSNIIANDQMIISIEELKENGNKTRLFDTKNMNRILEKPQK